MIDANIKGVLYGIAAILSAMTARGAGHVINIASIGGLHVTPTAAVYCATKFAVRANSDGLRQAERLGNQPCLAPTSSPDALACRPTSNGARSENLE